MMRWEAEFGSSLGRLYDSLYQTSRLSASSNKRVRPQNGYRHLAEHPHRFFLWEWISWGSLPLALMRLNCLMTSCQFSPLASTLPKFPNWADTPEDWARCVLIMLWLSMITCIDSQSWALKQEQDCGPTQRTYRSFKHLAHQKFWCAGTTPILEKTLREGRGKWKYFRWIRGNCGNRSESCSENCGFRIDQVVRGHSENGISYSENGISNSESCSENTPELSESSENGSFTPRAFSWNWGGPQASEKLFCLLAAKHDKTREDFWEHLVPSFGFWGWGLVWSKMRCLQEARQDWLHEACFLGMETGAVMHDPSHYFSEPLPVDLLSSALSCALPRQARIWVKLKAMQRTPHATTLKLLLS